MPSKHPAAREVVGHERSDLGQRVDEHQVEEELEGCHPRLHADRLDVLSTAG